jgi:CheY-like chemotaxis protein
MTHKLLLADDSITIQRVIELTFADEDVQVLAVGDGKHAIARIQSDRPDIVLADVGMPEQDGYEVAAFIKGHPQLSHIPVLLLTGAFEPVDEGRARAVGCDGVLVKPFEPQMVINRVKDLLAGRRAGATGTPNSNQPAAEPAAGQQAASAPAAASGQPQQPGDSLEDYFDRLDAAFATLGGEPAPTRPMAAVVPAQPPMAAASQPATAEDFASWDPDLAGDASRPAAHEPIHVAVVAPAVPAAPPPLSVHVSVNAPAPIPVVTSAPQPAAPVAAPPAAAQYRSPLPVSPPAAAPASAPISLAEAFAALLAAEHGQAIAPRGEARPSAGSAAAPSPAVVDDIVRRVIDRLQDQDMRQTVVDVAERLVREEIDRIKRANG